MAKRRRRFSPRVTRIWVAWLIISLPVPPARAADSPPTLEYQVKASMIYNFLHDVSWPPQSFESPAAPIGVCIIGRDPMGRALDRLAGEIAQGRAISVQRFSDWSEQVAASCNVLFLPEVEGLDADAVLANIRDYSILTIGEERGFLERGGIIRFAIVNGRVQFEINNSAARRARLIISAKLLRLATRVFGK